MNMKKCKSCGAEAPANAKFCPDCAAPLTAAAAKSGSGSKKRSNPLRDNLIIIGVIVVVAVGYLIMNRPKPVEPPPPASADMQNPHGGDMDAMMGALANMPQDYASLVQMGNQTMDQGNFAVAAECYKRALALEGSSNDVRTDYGACLHGMGLEHRALEEFRKVLTSDSRHAIANFNMGIVHYGLQQADSAKVYFSKYLEIDPQGGAAGTARSYLQEIGG